MILPTEALYLSHVLLVFHIPDKYNLPSRQWLQAEILRFLSAHMILHPEVPMGADLPAPVRFRNADSG